MPYGVSRGISKYSLEKKKSKSNRILQRVQRGAEHNGVFNNLIVSYIALLDKANSAQR